MIDSLTGLRAEQLLGNTYTVLQSSKVGAGCAHTPLSGGIWVELICKHPRFPELLE